VLLLRHPVRDKDPTEAHRHASHYETRFRARPDESRTLTLGQMRCFLLFPRQMLQEKADKICEMAGIMQKSIAIDDVEAARQREAQARLVTENKVSKNVDERIDDHFLFFQGLRDLLEISKRNGSLAHPIVGPKLVSRSCQTDPPVEETAGIATASPPRLPLAMDASTSAHSSSSPSVAPQAALSSTSALSPDHSGHNGGAGNRPRSSASSYASSTSSDPSLASPTNSVVMAQSWQDDRDDVLDAGHTGGAASEDSDEEITFNTIKRPGKNGEDAVTVTTLLSETKVNGVSSRGSNGHNGNGRGNSLEEDDDQHGHTTTLINGELVEESSPSGKMLVSPTSDTSTPLLMSASEASTSEPAVLLQQDA